jgi:energy-coupling factor transporter transmembrane protein EcfT
MFFESSVWDEVAFALRNFGYSDDVVRKRVEWALKFFDLEKYSNHSPFNLSGGEKKRLAFAIVLAWSPPIIALDEPTIGQDSLQKEKMLHMIKLLNTQGHTIIMASHDIEFIADLRPRIIAISSGSIVSDGPAEDILSNPETIHRCSLLPPQMVLLLDRLKDLGLPIFDGLRFRPGKSFIHRIDPRVKLTISLLILSLAAAYVDLLILTLLISVEAFTVARAGVFRLWLKTLRGSMYLAALVFVITLLTRLLPGGPLVESLGYAVTYTYRLIVFLTSFSLFFLTTTPEEIALTLSKLKIPYEYIFAFVSAIRFTPVLADEMKSIMDAQRSRGLELDRGRFLSRVRKLIPVLIPLLVNVLRRSYELAEAMEVKCFGASKKRTYLRDLNIRPTDYAIFAAAIFLFATAIYLRVTGFSPFEALTGLHLSNGM